VKAPAALAAAMTCTPTAAPAEAPAMPEAAHALPLVAPPCLALPPPPPPPGCRWLWPWPAPSAAPPADALVIELRGLSDVRGPASPRVYGEGPLAAADAVAVPVAVLAALASHGVRAMRDPAPACAPGAELRLDLPAAEGELEEARVGVADEEPEAPGPPAADGLRLPPAPAAGPHADEAPEPLPGAALADGWERDLARLLGRPLVDLARLPVAVARSATDLRWTAARWSWADLIAELTTCGTVDGPDPAAAKKAGPMWAPLDLGLDPGATVARKGVRPVGVSLLCLDIDGDCDLMGLADAVAGWRHLWHTSASHRPEAPRARLVLPLIEPVPLEAWPAVWAAAERWAAEALGLTVDPACKDAGRGWFLPRVWAPEAEARLDWFRAGWAAEGRALAWRWLIAEYGTGAAIPSTSPAAPAADGDGDGARTIEELRQRASTSIDAADEEHRRAAHRWARYLRGMLDRACARVAGAAAGERHKTLRAEAAGIGGRLHLGGLSEREALDRLAAAAVAAGKPAGEAHRTALLYLQRGRETPLPPPKDRPPPRPELRR
jgi:hypothetical protein